MRLFVTRHHGADLPYVLLGKYFYETSLDRVIGEEAHFSIAHDYER
jgi:hypothetical protein